MDKFLRINAILCVFGLILFGCTNPSTDAAEPDATNVSSSIIPPTSQPATPIDAPAEIADIIFTGGTIITMDEVNPSAQGIAIRGDKIIAVRSDADMLRLRGQATKVIDLKGRVVLPGFIDSHTHRITQRYKWNFSTVEQAAQEALSQGWTGLTELAVEEGQFNELREAAEQGKLKVKVNAYLTANTFSGDPLPEWYKAYQPGQQFGPYLRIAGLKVFIDGNSGRVLYWSQEELNEFLRQRQAEGWQISMKAIGIQSHELALSAYEAILQGQNNEQYRHRIEHSLAVNDDQLSRMARLQIIASIQPSFPGVIWYEPDIHALVNEEGQENIFRWREYYDAGVFMVASPFNPDGVNAEFTLPSHVSPMGLLYRSVTQIGLGDSQPEPWMLEKTLAVDEILPMLTINGAYATFEDETKGSLTAGKLADIVILSANPSESTHEQIKDIQVLMTMVNGKVEYCAAGAEALCPSTIPSNTNAIPIGFIDVPVPDETISGRIEIAGWALDEIKIDRIEIFLDGQFIGNATYGNPRPDVEHDYPGRPGTPNFGFIFNLNTASYSNGPHTIEALAINSSGNKSPLIPKKLTITINN